MIRFSAVGELRRHVGEEIATSDWMVVTQDRIDTFAAATGDHQWIHVDGERAARETTFGGTIAHGFLTLSLVSTLMRDAVAIDNLRMTINYGLNRVRFVSPLPAGSRVRARIALATIAEVADGLQATWNVTVERDGAEKPCVVAEWIVRYYPLEGKQVTQQGHEGRKH